MFASALGQIIEGDAALALNEFFELFLGLGDGLDLGLGLANLELAHLVDVLSQRGSTVSSSISLCRPWMCSSAASIFSCWSNLCSQSSWTVAIMVTACLAGYVRNGKGYRLSSVSWPITRRRACRGLNVEKRIHRMLVFSTSTSSLSASSSRFLFS